MSRRNMEKRTQNQGINRRHWLAMMGIGGATGLAGCLGNGDSENGDDNGSENGGDNETENGGDNGMENGDDNGTENGDDNGTENGMDGTPKVSGTYDTVTSAAFTTLNPLYNTEYSAGIAIGRALDQGYTFDDNNEYFPLLYDMSTENGEVWTFEVRDGLEFSDPYGQVTAEDFVYQIEELHKSGWANTAQSGDWSENYEVEQTGELEFQVTLPNPKILWPESFEPLLYPIPKDLVEPYVQEENAEGLQQDEELLELQFTGNLGAYVMDEWNRSAGTEYSRNDDYYLQNIDEGPDLFGGAPYFEGASISVVEEESSRLGALQTGEADKAIIPPQRYEEFDNNESVDVLQVPQPYNSIISVNMRDNGWNAGPGNLFRHKEFRQALAMAINKEELIQGVYRGLAEPHYTWQPRWSPFYPGDDEIPQYGSGDLYGADAARERAQEAFDQSEYDYSFDGEAMVNPDGDQVSLDIYHSAGQNTEQLAGEFIAQELGNNLGIDVTVEAIDGTRFDNEYWTAEPEGGTDTVNGEEVEWARPTPNNPGPRSVTANEDWDMSLVFGLNTFPRNPLTNRLFFNGPTAFYNPVGYYPEFNAGELWAQAQQATSQEEITQALEEIFINLAEEQPFIMLTFDDELNGYNPDLVGPIENFSNGWDFPAWHFDN